MELEVRRYPFILGREKVVPEHEVVVTSPYTGDEVGRTGNATALEVERALEVASAARTRMARLSGRQRQQALLELERLLLANQDELALLISSEAGKPIRDARAEVMRGVLTVLTAAEEAVRIGGEVLPLDLVAGGGRTLWHHPPRAHRHHRRRHALQLSPQPGAAQSGAGHRRGNPIIVKASPRTPLTALRLGELAMGLDLPDGAVSVLSGGRRNRASTAARRPHRHAVVHRQRRRRLEAEGRRRPPPRHPRTGRQRRQPSCTRTPTWMPPPPNWCAAPSATPASPASRCSASSFTAPFMNSMRGLLIERTRALRVGDPLEESTDVGPMITEEAAIRAVEWIDEAVAGGARVLSGGTRDGGFVDPTILENVRGEMRICREEAFAPVHGADSLRHTRRGHPRNQRQPLRIAGRPVYPRSQLRPRRRFARSKPAPSSSTTSPPGASIPCPTAASRSPASAAKASAPPSNP